MKTIGVEVFVILWLSLCGYECSADRCEAITVKLCSSKHMWYNMTTFPSILGSESQGQVERDLPRYVPLVEAGCSNMMRPFLCALHLPVCSAYGSVVQPCRYMCEEVMESCKTPMRKNRIPPLPCGIFPEPSEATPCIGISATETGQKKNCKEGETDEEEEKGEEETEEEGENENNGEDENEEENGEGKEEEKGNGRCEEITVPLCNTPDTFYNMTQLPNLIGSENQAQVEWEQKHLYPLVEAGCSDMIRPFLCALYLPLCSKDGSVVQSCRYMCEEIMESCKAQLTHHGIPPLPCNMFPEPSETTPCIGSSAIERGPKPGRE